MSGEPLDAGIPPADTTTETTTYTDASTGIPPTDPTPPETPEVSPTPPQDAPVNVTVAPAPEGVGDTPQRPGDEPHFVDTSGDVHTTPEGDTTKAGHVSEVENADPNLPTAGDLRAAGYVVPPDVPDDEVPTRYAVDTPPKTGEVHLVADTSYDDGVNRTLTPNQFLAAQSGAEATPGEEGSDHDGDTP